jgi:membrane protein YqaA with SNARE-associated domain
VKSFISWIYGFALAIGGPGLCVIAFLDSSLVSLPQINDLLVVLMVTQNKPWMVYYAAMATLGSVAGCYVIYYLAGKGGEAFLRRRMKQGHLEKTLAAYKRHGLLALMVPALLPPPVPFKVFVLMAGAAAVSPWRFGVAIVIGRGIRYFGQGYLAVLYGERAADFMKEYGAQIGIGLAVLAVVIASVVIWLRRPRETQKAPTE